MVGQFRLQRSLQDCFRELFQKAVLADDVFRLLVIGQQLINECLVDGHRFPFSSSDGRLHSPFYTLFWLRVGRQVHLPSVSWFFYLSCSLWFSPHFHRKFGVRIAQQRRLATRSTLRGCQGRPEGAFILTLDSPASHFIIELGTKRNAVQWSFVP